MKKLLFVLVYLLFSAICHGQSCTLTADIKSSGTVICAGSSLVLTADANNGTAPYTYTWSTGETTPFISINKPGTYTLSVSDNTPGCQPVRKTIVITSINNPAAPSVADIAVCQGTTGTLRATGPGGTYQWYDAPTGGNFLASGPEFVTPAINQYTVYYVETSVSGCLSTRRAVNVYVYAPPGTANGTACAGSAVTLSAKGYNEYMWFDSPAGGVQVGTGNTFITPALMATKTYYVSGVINGCVTARNPATAFITPLPQPPVASGVTICSGTSADLEASAPAGTIDWFDVPTGGTSLITSPDFTTPLLTETKTYYVQVTTACASARTPVTVTVTQIPPPPTSTQVVTCPGTSARLVANTTSGVAEWFSRPVGGTVLASGNTFDTPPLNIATTYYVQANNGGCISSRTPVVVSIETLPDAPEAAGILICSGSTATLTAANSTGNYQWYDAATGGNLLASTASFVTPALTASKTYYVQAISANGCASIRTAVDVNVQAIAQAPVVSGVTICSGSRAVLSASGATSYQWFDAPTGGTLLGSGPVYVSPKLNANVNYYVQAITAIGCYSPRSTVTVIVNPIPAAPVGTGATVCAGSTATLSASTPVGSIAWYDDAIGGNLVGAGNNFTTPPLSAETTWYAETQNNGCVSSRTAVIAKLITGASPQFVYPYSTVCIGSGNISPTINNPAGGTFSASPAGLVFANNITGEINVSTSLPGKYTIAFSNNGACTTVSTANFTIGARSDAAFTYNSPFCQSGVNPLPVFSGANSAGVFTATPAGLVFVSAATGEIDLLKSLPGTYTVTNTIDGFGVCTPSTAQYTVIISPRAIVNAGPDQAIDNGNSAQLSGSITGAVNTGRWSGGSGTFSDATALNPVYTAGPGENVATLTLTSADPAGSCGPATDVVRIYFGALPPTPTVAGTTVCSGTAATLQAVAPGGIYRWYDAATGGNLLSTGDIYQTPALTADRTFYVSTEVSGYTSPRRAVTVKIAAPPTTPIVDPPTVCTGSKAVLNVSNAASSLTYNWYSAATGGNLLAIGTTYTTPELNGDISFYVEAAGSECTSTRTRVNVKVTPYAQVTSAPFAQICSGNPLSYNITSDAAGATFRWSRAAVPGISNPAVSNQTSATITESLLNTSASAIDVTYRITPIIGSCAGAPFDHVVTVNPNVNVTSPATTSVCNGNGSNYRITFDKPVDSFMWSRQAVAGISNLTVSGQSRRTIREKLFNTTNAPIDVTYVFTYNIGNCSDTFTLTVNVKPAVSITSADAGSACNDVPLAYHIVSNVPSATFLWSRPAAGGNPAISGQTSNIINERLINNTTDTITAIYTIQPTAFGCTGPAFSYSVVVNPTPPTPVATNNSPVCVASTVMLYAKPVANATYLWTGPGGWTSQEQNPSIPASAATAGRYSLTLRINGCDGPTAYTDVVVNPVPTADAGTDRAVCPTANAITLNGQIGGGATKGIWSSSGAGQFSPAPNVLTASYIPTAADKAAGSVILTLTSTSPDDCAAASSNINIVFGLLPAVEAGVDQEICSRSGSVQLNAKLLAGSAGVWSTNGAGTFSSNALNAVYMPAASDIAAKTVKLTFRVNDAGGCYYPADELSVSFIPPPILDAGGTRYVLKGRQITLTPTVSDENVSYRWSPDIGINNTAIKNPVITGDVDTKYTLTVTDIRGCTTTADIMVRVSPQLTMTNAFTPNGDGINDTWNIIGLVAYEEATVDIFDRNGQRVFRSLGYPTPWDGTTKGQQVPAGVYYYVIDTKLKGKMTGSVTVIR